MIIFETSAIFDSLSSFTKYGALNEELEGTDKRDDVRNFVSSVLQKALPTSTICFITDSIYGNEIYYSTLTSSLDGRLIYILSIIDSESFEDSQPSEKVVLMLNVMKSEDCDYYVILITNGIQMTGFLKYADYNRLLSLNSKFIMLHDYRLFTPANHYLWKRLINVVFIRKSDAEKKTRLYELSTVPFPSIIRGIYVSKIINYFIPPNRFLKKSELFDDKKSDEINGNSLNVVVYPHAPAVMKDYMDFNATEIHYSGLEIELIKAIRDKMNFDSKIYETPDNDIEKWGQRIADGNYTGLLNEMNEARADIALADLYHTMYNLDVMDLSYPYTIQCLTFITPEILGDNSWKALILPFSLSMWIGSFVSLFFITIVFYLFSNFYRFIKSDNYVRVDSASGKKVLIKDLFDDFSACLLYPYSMILLVSLPTLPNRWSVRLLTGWWWIYCLLLIVAYRASLTSILANPQPRLTIDDLETLANSKIKCGAWGEQNRNLFLASSDPVAQKIGNKLENIDDAEDGVSFSRLLLITIFTFYFCCCVFHYCLFLDHESRKGRIRIF